MHLTYGSVCSGIEAASVAWTPLGWRPRFFSEVDPFCNELLRQRFPGVPNLGDIRGVGGEHGPVELLVGGTPCQSFSVNGRRDGLADPRGNLTLEYLRLLGVFRPRWFVLENVPGLLDVDGGEAFREVVRKAGELGYSCCWRVLDLQHFGVPQGRRRLFVVGRVGDWRRPAAVLFDARGREEPARPVRQVRGRGPGVVAPGTPVAWTGDPTPKFRPDLALTLRSQQGGEGAGVAIDGVLRRYTAREWERLMGLPDDWTLIDYQGKPVSYRRRTHAVGNSFPVPILSWIGGRINFLEDHT